MTRWIVFAVVIGLALLLLAGMTHAPSQAPAKRPVLTGVQSHRYPLGEHEHMDYISGRMGMPDTFTHVENATAAEVFGGEYYFGRTHAVQNCSARTVELARRVYQLDAAVLGYTFDDALAACTAWGVSSAPR